jgi:hypothetical protein
MRVCEHLEQSAKFMEDDGRERFSLGLPLLLPFLRGSHNVTEEGGGSQDVRPNITDQRNLRNHKQTTMVLRNHKQTTMVLRNHKLLWFCVTTNKLLWLCVTTNKLLWFCVTTKYYGFA